jgi:preprotein translocase subunit SecD
MHFSRLIWFIVIIAILAGLSVFNFNPNQSTVEWGKLKFAPLLKEIKLGLDLRGGSYFVLQAEDTPDNPVNDEAIQQVIQIIESRVNQLGVSEPVIQRVQGTNRIMVELPNVTRGEGRELIGRTAVLTFVDEQGNVVLTGADLTDSRSAFDNYNRPVVELKFNPEGTKKFADATTANVGKRIAIFLDEDLLTFPIVNEPIKNGEAVIQGMPSLQEAQKIALFLKAGALPVKVEMVQDGTVTATLGGQSIDQSIKAGLMGLLLVFIFMLVFYRLPGLVADIALWLYIILELAVFVAIKATLTLPGIAGFILSIGMAVDANVIIFERIKEELQSGRTVRAAIDAGFSRALRTVLDSNITTLIAAAVLFYLGTGPIKGFAVTLTIGIVMSMLTAVLFTKFVLKLLVATNLIKGTRVFGVKQGVK